MKLYGVIPAQWRDPWGGEHNVHMVVSVVAVRPAGRFPYDNGYTIDMNRVFVEDNGAVYVEVPPIDYGGSTYYIRQPKSIIQRVRWVSRLPIRCVDRHGHPIERDA